MASESQTVLQWLNEKPLTEIFTTFPGLLSVGPNDTVAKVARILAENNIYCVPVIEDGKSLGLIDLNDLLKSLCNIIGEVTRENGLEKLEKAVEFGNTFNAQLAKDLINLSGQNPYNPILYTSTLGEAVTKLISGTQRLPLVDEQGNILTIISPSLVIKYLSHHVTDYVLLKALHKKVEEFPEKSVVSVDCKLPVIIAIQKLNTDGAASLAITEDGNLISTFSLKDLKYIQNAASFPKLWEEIGEYVSEIRRNTPKSIYPAIHCLTTTSIESVLLRLSATGIHRMFVLAPNSHLPKSVISLRDVLRILLDH